MQRDAEISPCRKYRFSLTRATDDATPTTPTVAFILCNPSTADDELDDPTCRRGWGFAQTWGFGRMLFVNVNPYRATDPRLQLYPARWALEVNDVALCLAATSDIVVCAWGLKAMEALTARALHLLKGITPLHYLAMCADGRTPKHPLYLSSVLRPTPWDI